MWQFAGSIEISHGGRSRPGRFCPSAPTVGGAGLGPGPVPVGLALQSVKNLALGAVPERRDLGGVGRGTFVMRAASWGAASSRTAAPRLSTSSRGDGAGGAVTTSCERLGLRGSYGSLFRDLRLELHQEGRVRVRPTTSTPSADESGSTV